MESKDTYNPKSLCAIEWHIKALESRVLEMDTTIDKILIALGWYSLLLSRKGD